MEWLSFEFVERRFLSLKERFDSSKERAVSLP
jgi:hypothetical protein